jgi:hypothetical protein
MTKEYVRRPSNGDDSIRCLCGNHPLAQGFFPCDRQGNLAESNEAWIEPLYRCDRCGRIINSETWEVVDRVPEA